VEKFFFRRRRLFAAPLAGTNLALLKFMRRLKAFFE
jgi:hypothetical protein